MGAEWQKEWCSLRHAALDHAPLCQRRCPTPSSARQCGYQCLSYPMQGVRCRCGEWQLCGKLGGGLRNWRQSDASKRVVMIGVRGAPPITRPCHRNFNTHIGHLTAHPECENRHSVAFAGCVHNVVLTYSLSRPKYKTDAAVEANMHGNGGRWWLK